MEPLKRRFFPADERFEKAVGLGGARGRLMIDSMPTATGFSRISLNFRVISQAAFEARLGGGAETNTA